MGNLKIGFVLDDTLDTPDGVQQYVLTLGRWLVQQGHDVHYLVGATARTDIANVHSLSRNKRVQFNGNRMSTPLPTSRRLIRDLLARERFDVLHVQIPYSPFMAGRVVGSAPKSTAIVGTFHIAPNSASVIAANKILGRLLRGSLKKFDTIFSVSQAAADFASQAYGVDSTILPNVVRTDHFSGAMPVERDKTVPAIMFLGRLVPRKGCQVLLEAVRMLHAEEPSLPFQVYICGKGPLGDTLQDFVRQNGLDKVVTFTGFVDDDAKARYLKAADIAVFPSTGGESFGIVLIEAMAAGHPVVLGADNPGYASVLKDAPSQLFPVSDPAALAAMLRAYLSDEAMKTQALAWQKRHVMQFDVAMVGRRLVARYLQILRQKEDVR